MTVYKNLNTFKKYGNISVINEETRLDIINQIKQLYKYILSDIMIT